MKAQDLNDGALRPRYSPHPERLDPPIVDPQGLPEHPDGGDGAILHLVGQVCTVDDHRGGKPVIRLNVFIVIRGFNCNPHVNCSLLIFSFSGFRGHQQVSHYAPNEATHS